MVFQTTNLINENNFSIHSISGGRIHGRFFSGKTCKSDSRFRKHQDYSQTVFKGWPGGIKEFWTPTEADISDLEDKFKSCKGSVGDLDLEKKMRQYAGIVKAGKKIVYANIVRYRELPGRLKLKASKGTKVCDSGPTNFGFEYNPKTKEFGNFAFNGGYEGLSPEYKNFIFTCPKTGKN